MIVLFISIYIFRKAHGKPFINSCDIANTDHGQKHILGFLQGVPRNIRFFYFKEASQNFRTKITLIKNVTTVKT